MTPVIDFVGTSIITILFSHPIATLLSLIKTGEDTGLNDPKSIKVGAVLVCHNLYGITTRL